MNFHRVKSTSHESGSRELTYGHRSVDTIFNCILTLYLFWKLLFFYSDHTLLIFWPYLIYILTIIYLCSDHTMLVFWLHTTCILIILYEYSDRTIFIFWPYFICVLTIQSINHSLFHSTHSIFILTKIWIKFWPKYNIILTIWFSVNFKCED